MSTQDLLKVNHRLGVVRKTLIVTFLLFAAAIILAVGTLGCARSIGERQQEMAPMAGWSSALVQSTVIVETTEEADRLQLRVGTATPPYYLLRSATGTACLVTQQMWARAITGQYFSCHWQLVPAGSAVSRGGTAG